MFATIRLGPEPALLCVGGDVLVDLRDGQDFADLLRAFHFGHDCPARQQASQQARRRRQQAAEQRRIDARDMVERLKACWRLADPGDATAEEAFFRARDHLRALEEGQ
jgi:hypothetical protein